MRIGGWSVRVSVARRTVRLLVDILLQDGEVGEGEKDARAGEGQLRALRHLDHA